MSVCLTGLLENPVDVEDAVEVIHFMLTTNNPTLKAYTARFKFGKRKEKEAE